MEVHKSTAQNLSLAAFFNLRRIERAGILAVSRVLP
jgi:hypothetical protein